MTMQSAKPFDIGSQAPFAARPVFRWGRLTAFAALVAFYHLPLATEAQAVAQNCRGLLLSTSEDFTMQRGEGPDGNPIVSDGDLLAFEPLSGTTVICLRNRELLQPFDIERVDLGLDAAAALGRKRETIAFSTELDSIHGQFTAGDLLFRSSLNFLNGLIIPNAALLAQTKLQPPYDIGLDAVSFVGEEERLIRALREIAAAGREALAANPDLLARILREFEVDILFSVEGTAPTAKAPAFIDGEQDVNLELAQDPGK